MDRSNTYLNFSFKSSCVYITNQSDLFHGDTDNLGKVKVS